MRGEPPADVAPARLFRLLIRTPRPTWPVNYEIPGVEHGPLHVRGLRGLEEADAVDTAESFESLEVRYSRLRSHRIYLALCAEEGLVFRSADEPLLLAPREFDALSRAVEDALLRVSPTYARSHFTTWMKRLEEGAGAPANIAITMSLGRCIEVGLGHAAERPDLYFGIPLCDLTDGQWMAYRAACAVAGRIAKKSTQ